MSIHKCAFSLIAGPLGSKPRGSSRVSVVSPLTRRSSPIFAEELSASLRDDVMVNAPQDLTVTELERLLSSRKSQLDELVRKREKLQQQLKHLDQEIAALAGEHGNSVSHGRLGPRIKNERSLREYVVEILGRSKKGLSLVELAQKVLDAGYKSESANFRNVLYQCVYNTKDLYHDESTGTYRMKSVVAREMKKTVQEANAE